MENPVEIVLKNKGPRGLSMRHLILNLGVDRRRVNYHIFNSTNVMDTPPSLHGSGKSKIRVFNYTPETKNYFDRRVKSKKIVQETEVSGEI